MDKKLFLGTLLLGSLFSVNAQSDVWNDTFDDLDITNWTMVDADGDGQGWYVVQIEDDNGAPVGTPLLRSASWADDALTPDNWIISPAIDLTNASGQIMLNWEVMAIDEEWDEENYTVYVATEGTIATLEAGVTFTEVLSGINSLTSRSLDITDYAGETIYVAFRHHNSSGQFTMELDNISITAETLNVQDNSLSVFSVYPNPVRNIINISAPYHNVINSVFITDSNGRTVKSVVLNGAPEAKIDVSALQKGLYFINIVSGKEISTKKIIITK